MFYKIDKIRSNYLLIGIIVLSIFLNFYNLGDRTFQQDEAIYSAQSAMLIGHDEYRQNFLPYSRSATNFQIQQFITSISFRVFGINEFSARFPSAMMGILSVVMVYILAEMLFNKRVGLLSAFIMAVNGYVIHFTRQLQLDTGLMFFSLLAIICLVKWRKAETGTKKDRYFYFFLITTILAILTKITAIFILVPLIIFYLYIEKEYDNAIQMLDRPISAIIILITLSFLLYFIFFMTGYNEFIKTFTYAADRTSKYSYTYYINIMIGYVGYGILLISIIGLIYILKHWIERKKIKEGEKIEKTKEDLFIAFWFLFGIIFFSIYSLKAYSYILPIMPAVSILNGKVLDNFIGRFKNFKIAMVLALMMIIISIFPALNYSYAKIDNLNEIGPEIIIRYNPIKDYILKDTALWLKENVDSNVKIAVYIFPNHHSTAFYSGLQTYTIKFEPGIYIPVNKTAKIIWSDPDTTGMIKNGEIDYVLYLSVGDQRLARILMDLEKKENIDFIPIYQKNYTVPEWYSDEGLNVTVYKVQRNKKELRFITVGDPQVSSINTENKGNERLTKIVNFINDKKDIDFVIFTGDMTKEGTNESNIIAKRILANLTKPYYVVAGDRDIPISEDNFRLSYGPMKHKEYINGYQLLFVGIFNRKDEYGNIMKLGWSFNFSKIDKNMRTLIFTHGPMKDPPPECVNCRWDKDLLKYGYGMESELNKLTNLLGVYSGHVRYDSDQMINGVRYITINGLVTESIGNITANPSDNIGYTIIKDNNLDYQLIPY